MNLRFLPLILFLIAMTLPHSAKAADNPLAQYRWKNRLVVLYFPKNQEAKAALSDLESKIRDTKAQLLDRDMLLFHAGEWLPARKVAYSVALSAEERAILRDRLDLEGDRATLVLIGKDGGVKQRQSAPDFSMERMFALIDTMPMRKEEMRAR